MPRRAAVFVSAPLMLLLAACGLVADTETAGFDDGGGGERRMTGTWEVRIDPDRTVRLELDGSFNVTEDKSEAAAGETDIMVETFGVITATNISDGRDFTGISTGLQLFVPIEHCPDWGDTEGTHCTRDLVSFDIPDLDVDESETFDISDSQRATDVPTDAGPAVGGVAAERGRGGGLRGPGVLEPVLGEVEPDV